MAVDIYVNGELLDLYEDENITLTSSLKQYTDVTKAHGDVTQEFSVPASGVNNIILNRFADAEIVAGDNYLDYRIKVPAYLDIDGMQAIDGYITYNKCLYKNNKMDTHILAFTSSILSITEEIGDDTLQDLNFSAYNHVNDPLTVQAGLLSTPYLFNGDIRYSLMTNNPTEWKIERLKAGIPSSEFRPSIKVGRILDAINAKYPINIEFINNFPYSYGELPYENLYMWAGNRVDEDLVGGVTNLSEDSASMWFNDIDWDSDYIYFDGNAGIFGYKNTSVLTNIRFKYNVYPDVTLNPTDPYFIEIFGVDKNYQVGEKLHSISISSGGDAIGEYIVDPNDGAWDSYNYYMFTLRSGTPGQEMEFDYDLQYDMESPYITYGFKFDFDTQNGFKAANTNITTTPIQNKMNLKMPPMKVIDFIKGFMTLYNAVIYPKRVDAENFETAPRDSYYMEPYNSWRDLRGAQLYTRGGNNIEYNEETDITSHSVVVPPIPKTLNIKYKEPKAIANKSLKEFRGVGYGDLKQQSDSGTGASYDINLPFENMMYTKTVDSITGDNYLIGYAVSNSGTFNTTDETYDYYEGLQGIYDGVYLQLFEPTSDEPCSILLTSDTATNNTATSYSAMNSYTGGFGAKVGVTLLSGSSGFVNAILINGVNVMSAPVPFNTSLDQTATDVASNINLYSSTSGYAALTVVGNKITITGTMRANPLVSVHSSYPGIYCEPSVDNSAVTTANTLNYGQEVDYLTDLVQSTNLYDKVYKDYLELFLNPTTRIHNYKIRLTPVDLNYLFLYKTVQIGDKYFTINKYKYNSQTQMADFELIRYLRDIDGDSSSSPTDYVAPTFCTLDYVPNAVPTTPSNVSAYDITSTKAYQFTLRWDLSTSTDSVIDKYEIYKNGVLYTTQEDGTRDTYSINGLPPDYTANWTIQAVDNNGLRSEFSVPLEVTTASLPGPEFNEPITLDLATPYSLDISWLPATAGISPIQYYEIYVNDVLYGTRYVTDDLDVTIDGLTPDTIYNIFILAYEKAIDCDCGRFAQSDTYQFETLLPVAFNGTISLVEATYDSLEISWLPAIPGYPIDYYEIYVNGLLYDTVDSAINTAMIENLDYSTSYNIYVKVFDISRASDASNTVAFNTLTPTGPTFNNPVSVNFTTLYSISINWLDSTPNPFEISHYDMYINGVLDGTVSANDPNEYTFTGLTDGVSYAIYVKAVDINNFTKNSDTINVLTSSTITTGISAVYEMNDTNTVMVDSGPYGLNGTNINVSLSQPGKLGSAYLLNGSTSYMTTPVVNSGTSGSISMWIKTTNNLYDYDTYWSNREPKATATRAGEVWSNINGTGGVPTSGSSGFWTSVSTNGSALISSGGVNNQTWRLLTYTWEGGNKTKIYIDSILVSEIACPSYVNLATTQVFWIGKDKVELQQSNLGAYVDQTCFWNRAITQTEVNQIYNNGNGIAYPFT